MPEVSIPSLVVRAAQPTDVEQVLSVPVLHMDYEDYMFTRVAQQWNMYYYHEVQQRFGDPVPPESVQQRDVEETDSEDEEEEEVEEEEEERRTWIDDNDDAWALIDPPGQRPHWRNLRQNFSQWHPPWEPPPGQGGI